MISVYCNMVRDHGVVYKLYILLVRTVHSVQTQLCCILHIKEKKFIFFIYLFILLKCETKEEATEHKNLHSDIYCVE